MRTGIKDIYFVKKKHVNHYTMFSIFKRKQDEEIEVSEKFRVYNKIDANALCAAMNIGNELNCRRQEEEEKDYKSSSNKKYFIEMNLGTVYKREDICYPSAKLFGVVISKNPTMVLIENLRPEYVKYCIMTIHPGDSQSGAYTPLRMSNPINFEDLLIGDVFINHPFKELDKAYLKLSENIYVSANKPDKQYEVEPNQKVIYFKSTQEQFDGERIYKWLINHKKRMRLIATNDNSKAFQASLNDFEFFIGERYSYSDHISPLVKQGLIDLKTNETKDELKGIIEDHEFDRHIQFFLPVKYDK